MRDTSPQNRTVDLESFVTAAASAPRGQIIRDGSPKLNKKQRQFLRGLGQSLQPVVMIGSRGPVRSIVDSTSEQLDAHELIKIKLQQNTELTPEVAALWLRGETGAQIVQILGHTLVLYRPRAKNRRIKLPR